MPSGKSATADKWRESKSTTDCGLASVDGFNLLNANAEDTVDWTYRGRRSDALNMVAAAIVQFGKKLEW